jgi:hypothetical protein
MGTLSACGVLHDGAPRADGFFQKKQPKNYGEILFVVKMTVILRMKAWPRSAMHKKKGKLALFVTHILFLLAKNERLAYNEIVYTCIACGTPFVEEVNRYE